MKSEPNKTVQALTMREHLAAMAMQGLLSGNALYGGKENKLLLTQDAVLHADALINALNTNTDK